MSEIYNYLGLRCEVSKNPCGTDTHPKDSPCQCGPCRACDRIAELEATICRISGGESMGRIALLEAVAEAAVEWAHAAGQMPNKLQRSLRAAGYL